LNKIEKEFIELLREYNSLTMFCANLAKPDWANPLCDLKNPPLFKYMMDNNHNAWIFFAFDWTNTPEGYTFWDNLNDLWMGRLKCMNLIS
jgi:hypothetical protein